MELVWFEQAARQFQVPLPAKPSDLAGSWGQFVLALDAYRRGDYETAVAQADLAACGEVDGFAGLHDQAVLLRQAAQAALGGVQLRRSYRITIDVELPPLPRNVDFTDKPWELYGQAVRAARLRDAHKCQLLVYKGICAARGVAGHPAVWFLKALGKAMTTARTKGRKFPDGFDPQDPDAAAYVFKELGIVAPSPRALASPAWLSAAQALVAFDRQSWGTCQRRMHAAWSLPGPERDHLERVLDRLAQKLPRRMVSANTKSPSHGRVRMRG